MPDLITVSVMQTEVESVLATSSGMIKIQTTLYKYKATAVNRFLLNDSFRRLGGKDSKVLNK